MLFTEPVFLFLFLPAVLAAHFFSPRRARNPILLLASLLFYAWGEREYVIVLLASILLNYLIGRVLGHVDEMKRRRWLLSLGIVANLVILGSFKYPGFVMLNLNRVLGIFHFASLPVPLLHIPLGVSFFTLIGMAYIIEVYRKGISPEKKLSDFSLYMAFFPYLIAGPLTRYGNLASELVERRVRLDQFAAGIRRFTLGLGKKMLIANTLAITVDSIFKIKLTELSPGLAWLAAICYPVQLYFDISGYADVAIGLALMFGFHLPENFNYPYVAQSMTDFWRRWHITLVSWFRDYLFYPMSYRRPAWRIHLNLFIVFLLCGLWHEGSWKFVFWGALHGSILALERVGLGRQLLKLPRVVRHLYVILMIIGSCVFVRATSFTDALRFLARMIGVGSARGEGYGLSAYLTRPLMFALAVGVVGCLPLLPKLRGWLEVFANDLAGFRRNLLDTGVGLFKITILTVIFLASVSLSAAGTYNAFIYFNF